MFAERYGPLLRAYLAARWRLPCEHEDVADAVQEVFLRLFKPAGALERVESGRPGGFRAFLYGVARNVAADLDDRRRIRATASLEQAAEVESRERSLSQVFDRAWVEMLSREARKLLERRASKSAPAMLRLRALDLCYSHGLKSREIARHLSLDVWQVYPMLSAARKEFRATFLETLAYFHPEASRATLEQLGAELLRGLGAT
jgi:RNA polymerase sigma factor (sigma-70 family)